MSDNKKIMSVEQCGYVGKCMSSPSSYASYLPGYGEKTTKRIAAHALQQLEAARLKDVQRHEQNLPAIENNKAIAERVKALMQEIEMPKRWSERDRNSRSRYPKTISHDAGYLTDLAREVKTDDGFAHATATYESLLRTYKAYVEHGERDAEQAKRKAELDAAAALEKRKADIELAAILLRYSLPIESTWSEVLEELRKRDQRLDLAVAMEDTRGDWSEGPYRVRDAIDRFTIETNEDKEIANDIISHLSDWCGDGRCFRDTTWSYDRLYSSVADQQLAQDARTARERARD